MINIYSQFFELLIKNKDINQEQVIKRKYEFTRDKTIEYLENRRVAQEKDMIQKENEDA